MWGHRQWFSRPIVNLALAVSKYWRKQKPLNPTRKNYRYCHPFFIFSLDSWGKECCCLPPAFQQQHSWTGHTYTRKCAFLNSLWQIMSVISNRVKVISDRKKFYLKPGSYSECGNQDWDMTLCTLPSFQVKLHTTNFQSKQPKMFQNIMNKTC